MKQRAPAVVLACDSQLLSPVSEKSTCRPVLSVCTHCGSGSCQCAPWQPVGPTYIHTCEAVRKKTGRVSYTDHFTQLTSKEVSWWCIYMCRCCHMHVTCPVLSLQPSGGTWCLASGSPSCSTEKTTCWTAYVF